MAKRQQKLSCNFERKFISKAYLKQLKWAGPAVSSVEAKSHLCLKSNGYRDAITPPC